MALTRDGWAVVVGSVSLAAVAWISGNNLLYLVAAPVWAVLVLAAPLSALNLRGLQVRRVLPGELYAGREAPGELLVRAAPGLRLGAGGALDLHVADVGTGAIGHLPRLPAGRWVSVAVRWRFPTRGRAPLTAVEIRSTYPFGLLTHVRRLALPARILVYPRPHPASGIPRAQLGAGLVEGPRSGGGGELVELRAYQPGDAPKRIHWPTSARLGLPVVAERAEERAPIVIVDVQRVTPGAAWERELSRACGEILRALALGHPVGLRLPELPGIPARAWPPGVGGRWRRELLDALAQLPRQEP